MQMEVIATGANAQRVLLSGRLDSRTVDGLEARFAAAVESMDEETATVLIAATSHREGPNAPKEDQQPRVWRVVVTVQRDGGQIKMSDVEFA